MFFRVQNHHKISFKISKECIVVILILQYVNMNQKHGIEM